MIKMSKALVNNETKDIKNAKSGEIGECLVCKNPVIAKCGKVNAIHWAHIGNESLYDIESHNEWHISWKKFFERIGYTTEKKFGNFIADAYNPKTNTVIEYQHSSITSQEIIDRCKYHKNEGRNIMWIFDYTNKYKNNDIKINKKLSDGNKFYYTFEIKHQKKNYVYGISDEKSKYPNVPTYFNVIFNCDNNNCYPLKIIKEVDIDDVKDEDDVISQIFSQRTQKIFSEIEYNKTEFVLLKIKTIHEKGKRGSCELIFI